MSCMCGAEDEVVNEPIPGQAGTFTIKAPEGKLGLVFQGVDDPSGEYGHVVARLTDSSPLAGVLETGDVIEYIDAGSAVHLNHNMISKSLQNAQAKPRQLTVIRGAIKGSDGAWAPAA